MFKVPFEVRGKFRKIWPDLKSESAVATRVFCDPEYFDELPSILKAQTVFIVLDPSSVDAIQGMEYYLKSQEVRDYVKSRWDTWYGADCDNLLQFTTSKVVG